MVEPWTVSEQFKYFKGCGLSHELCLVIFASKNLAQNSQDLAKKYGSKYSTICFRIMTKKWAHDLVQNLVQNLASKFSYKFLFQFWLENVAQILWLKFGSKSWSRIWATISFAKYGQKFASFLTKKWTLGFHTHRVECMDFAT